MLLYVYFFNLTVEEEGRKVVKEKAIYAASEKDARKTFKKFFDVEAGELLRRDHW